MYIQHTKTATWFSSSLSAFFVPKHWPPRRMFASMVPDRNQTVSNRRRKEFSVHAPTMENRCVMRHCHRSSSKSGQNFVSFCDSLVFCCFLWLSATKDTYQRQCLECLHTGLQTFRFIRWTSSPNSGFALCPRFAATKFICTSFSCCQLWSWNCQNAAVFTPKTEPKTATKDPTVGPSTSPAANTTATTWHQAPPLCEK